MGRITFLVVAVVLAVPAVTMARKCPADSVQVGDVCVDKYEASVWSTTDARTIGKIQRGKIASALEIVGTQHGIAGDDYGAGCPDTAAGCTDYYAVSIPGVTPSSDLTQFQASAACRNAGKHLATNQEWQAAALGTPDPTDDGTTTCNMSSVFMATNTGSRTSCVSDAGAFDMVGNVGEWVADWVPLSTGCPGWGAFSYDNMCMSGASTVANGPGAVARGGNFGFGAIAGPFSLNSDIEPTISVIGLGFRCARRL